MGQHRSVRRAGLFGNLRECEHLLVIGRSSEGVASTL